MIKQLGSNQTLLKINENEFFYSYETLVAAKVGGVYYRTNRYYSKTTSKHINNWLGDIKAVELSPEELNKLSIVG